MTPSCPPPETRFRRFDFVGGLPVRLADGQDWAFAGPREIAALGPTLRGVVEGLLVAINEAEDEHERLRGELALAIGLLALNYELTPTDYTRLLYCETDDPQNAVMQAGFHDLTLRHAEALLPRTDSAPPPRGRRFRFPAFLPHRPLGQARRDKKKAC